MRGAEAGMKMMNRSRYWLGGLSLLLTF